MVEKQAEFEAIIARLTAETVETERCVAVIFDRMNKIMQPEPRLEDPINVNGGIPVSDEVIPRLNRIIARTSVNNAGLNEIICRFDNLVGA